MAYLSLLLTCHAWTPEIRSWEEVVTGERSLITKKIRSWIVATGDIGHTSHTLRTFPVPPHSRIPDTKFEIQHGMRQNRAEGSPERRRRQQTDRMTAMLLRVRNVKINRNPSREVSMHLAVGVIHPKHIYLSDQNLHIYNKVGILILHLPLSELPRSLSISSAQWYGDEACARVSHRRRGPPVRPSGRSLGRPLCGLRHVAEESIQLVVVLRRK